AATAAYLQCNNRRGVPRMMNVAPKAAGFSPATISAVALASMVVSVTAFDARAGEAEAKSLVKAMSDYLAAQKSISFGFDTNLQVVTKEHQKLSLMSSGTVNLSRPDKIRSTRTGGFANIETNFDGKTLTLLGKNSNVYLQAEIPGTLDHVIDVLREKYHT